MAKYYFLFKIIVLGTTFSFFTKIQFFETAYMTAEKTFILAIGMNNPQTSLTEFKSYMMII